MITLKEAALYYATRCGWPVIPLHFPIEGRCSCGRPNCPSPAKHPIGHLVPNGVHDATTNPEIIEAWWSEEPNANIGVCTGGGRVVIDVDPRKGGDTSLLSLELPDAPTQLTGGGGEHRVFTCTVAIPNSAGLLGPGLDVRGENGYIVAAPSMHISGRVYQWEVDHTPAKLAPPPLPRSVLDLLKTNGNGSDAGRDRGLLPERLTEGERNDKLFRHACRLRRAGYNEAEILEALTIANMRRCHPPLAESELARIAASACRYEPSDPLRLGEVPVEYVAPRRPISGDLPFDLLCTDAGNAQGIAKDHREHVRFVHDWKCWVMWDGRRWREDTSGAIIALAEEYVRGLYAAAVDLPNAEHRKKLAAHAIKCLGRQRLEAAVELLKAENGISIRQETLDAEPLLINCRNGVLNLDTDELLPHHPSFMMTKLAGAEYRPDARCPTWERFIKEVTLGREELAGYLQRALGYALTGDTSEQVLFLLHGVGANGKSTLLDVVRSVLGDYARTASFDTFLAQRQAGSPRDDLAYLSGARFVCATEPRADGRLDESVVKQLTGGEAISCRRLYGPIFEYRPTYKLFLACNQKPTIRGTDHGIWRRVKLVPFDMVVPENQQRKHLAEELLEERDGILTWMVRGCRDWLFMGLSTPNEVNEVTEEYREDFDPFGEFIRECCDVGPQLSAPAMELYRAYKAFCEKGGVPAHSMTSLGRYLSERGFQIKRDQRGRKHRTGLALKGSLEL